MITKEKDQVKIDGWVNVHVARVDSKMARDMESEIGRMMREGVKDFRDLIVEFNKRFAVRELRFHNIVPTVGRQQIAKALTGNIADETEIAANKSALGTGTGTPANANTTLGTEVFRKDIASLSYAANIAYLTAVYLAADTNGTFYEHGMFIDGTGVADSGILLTRVLLNAPTGIAKSAIETLTIEHQLTIS